VHGRRAQGRDRTDSQRVGGDSTHSGDSSSRPEVIGRGGRDFSYPVDAPDSGRRTGGPSFDPQEYHEHQLHLAAYDQSRRGHAPFHPSYGEDGTAPPAPTTRGGPYDTPYARGQFGDGRGHRSTQGYHALSTPGPPYIAQPYRRPPMHGHNWGHAPDEPMPWDGEDRFYEPPPDPTALHRTRNFRGLSMYKASRDQAHNEARGGDADDCP
jgi:hypothetical protein